MFLVIGLGNSEDRYAKTRHNMGFIMLDCFAEDLGASFHIDKKMAAETADGHFLGHHLILAKPTTYMNLSGIAVSRLLKQSNIALAHLLILCDDADLPFGKLRLRLEGSSGGHNGLKSIEEELGTQAYARLRVGIGRDGGELADYVLSPFTQVEQQSLDQIAAQVREMLYGWMEEIINHERKENTL